MPRVRQWPPGPTATFPGFHWFSFRRDPISFLRTTAREYGDVASFRVGSQRIVLINHPDLILDVLVTQARKFHKGRGLQRAKRLLGEGLLTSEGEFHLRQRRLVQPAFHRQRLADYAQCMVEYGQRVTLVSAEGKSEDIAAAMMRLTLVIVGKALFDADVVDGAAQITRDVNEMLSLFQLLMLPFAELLEKLPLPAVHRFREARGRLDEVIYRMIREHRDQGGDQGDLLSMLLNTREEDGSGMSDLQIRDEVMTLFLAGHETTSNALTWTWYLLSQNPKVEAAFHAELEAVLAGRPPGFDDLPRLPYTRAVLSESMRLFPPAWILGRRVVSEYEVGGYRLPEGTVVVLSQAVTHRDARWFPDPDRFDPTRWTQEADPPRPRFAYFPFGGGPRTCVGEQFAWMEGVLLLATLGQTWRMRLDPDQQIACLPGITLRPRFGMRMFVEKRG